MPDGPILGGPLTATPALARRTRLWVIGLALVGLIFDGYDLVVYGAVMPKLRQRGGLIFEALSPAHQSALLASEGVDKAALTPEMKAALAEAANLGGALGSYALFGVLVGALFIGAVGDRIGRRIPMLASLAWLSLGMAATAMTTSVASFGLMRFLTGLGIGALVATTGAVVAEFAAPGRRHIANALVYSGVPLGSSLSAVAAMTLLPSINWQGLFWLGAIPLVTLLPLALWKLPESPAWLASRGRHDDARAASERTGIPLPEVAASGSGTGFAGLFSRRLVLATVLLGLLSATGLLLVYSLNTWLPQLTQPLLGPTSSLALLVALNGGAVVGGLTGSLLADRVGAKRVIAGFFTLGAVAILLSTLTATPALVVLMLAVIALAGMGTSGTQTLIYGYVANYYPTRMRAAAVAWCAGFGRLGGVLGPVVGGWLAAAFPGDPVVVLYVLAAVCLAGVVFCLLTPKSADEA